MKVLVTGAAGFIGSNLCRFLIDKKYKVYGVDNLSTGSIHNLSGLHKGGYFNFSIADITDPVFYKVKFDQIYNLACPASPIHYQSDPIKTMDVNYIGVKNLLDYAKINNSKFLQASTSEVYGDPQVHPQHEKYNGSVNISGPRACYDEGKRIAEVLVTQYDVDTRIARIFNTYGPRMQCDDGRVVTNFIHQALNGDDITIYGDGNQTRSFCYISDMIKGLYDLMESSYLEPINLGNPTEIKIKDLARIILLLTGSKSKISYKPLPVDDPVRRRPDISKAKNILNFTPSISIYDGLQETINFIMDK